MSEHTSDEVDGPMKNMIKGCFADTSKYMTEKEFESPKYKMDHKDRGTVLIISNTSFKEVGLHDRDEDDATADVTKLTQRFKELGFASEDILVKKNLTREEFITELNIGDDGVVYAKDGTLEIDQDIFRLFRSEQKQRKYLADKPKVFIIQSAKGTSRKEYLFSKDGGALSLWKKLTPHRIPTDANFFSYISTLPEKWNDHKKGMGSYFVRCLSKAMEDYGTSLDFLSVCVQANGKIVEQEPYKSSDDVQIPCITSMLLKDLCFPAQE